MIYLLLLPVLVSVMVVYLNMTAPPLDLSEPPESTWKSDGAS